MASGWTVLTAKESCISQTVSSGCTFTETVPISVSERKKPLKQHNGRASQH